MPDDFGSQLRRARVRKGLDVNTVARRLRIRPDIIQAIEESDFQRMPPRGYARNMINSYAQLLGLNASEVTRLYLDEQYAYQVNSARKNARGTGFSMPSGRQAAARAEAENMRRRSRDHYEVAGYEQGDLSQPRYGRGRPRDRYRDLERPGRRMYDDYDSGRIMSRAEAERTYRSGGHRSQRSALAEDPVFNAVASPAPSHVFGGRFSNVNWPLIVAGAVALVLVIILGVMLFSPKGSSSSSGEAANLSVSAASESTGAEVESGSTAATPPTSFTFSYNVNSGAKPWIEVYIDGQKQIAQYVEGPSTKTFTTSGVLEFICSDVNGVKATQDGKDLALIPDAKGVVDIRIDFNDVLATWQVEHGLASSSAAAAASTASSSGASAASGSTTTADATAAATATAATSGQGLRGIDAEARAQADAAAAEKKAQEEDDSDEDEDSEEEDSDEEDAEDEEYEGEDGEAEYEEGEE